MQSTHKHTVDAIASSQRGSALIISIIFTAVITIGLAGLLPMMLTEWKSNSRNSAQEAAFSLAESGVDEAIWAILEYGSDEELWIKGEWKASDNGNYWYKEWALAEMSVELGDIYSLDEGREGLYRVIAQKINGSVINIVSQGIVIGGSNVASDFEVTRYIETQFRRPNPAGYGLIARDGLDFNGKPFFDSYDSREFPYDYSFEVNSGDEVTVGSVSEALVKLDLGNSIIYGDLATGGADDGSDPRSGSTVTGDMIWDFDMDFPEVTKPAGYTSWSAP
ncbi:MAG: pilus assembly PilX family protein [Opitutaceae bacterium]